MPRIKASEQQAFPSMEHWADMTGVTAELIGLLHSSLLDTRAPRPWLLLRNLDQRLQLYLKEKVWGEPSRNTVRIWFVPSVFLFFFSLSLIQKRIYGSIIRYLSFYLKAHIKFHVWVHSVKFISLAQFTLFPVVLGLPLSLSICAGWIFLVGMAGRVFFPSTENVILINVGRAALPCFFV